MKINPLLLIGAGALLLMRKNGSGSTSGTQSELSRLFIVSNDCLDISIADGMDTGEALAKVKATEIDPIVAEAHGYNADITVSELTQVVLTQLLPSGCKWPPPENASVAMKLFYQGAKMFITNNYF